MYSPNIPITEGIIKNSSNRPTKVVCRPRAGSAESVPAAVCSGTGSWFCCDFFVLLDDDPMLVVMCILCKIFRCCFYRLKRCLGMQYCILVLSRRLAGDGCLLQLQTVQKRQPEIRTRIFRQSRLRDRNTFCVQSVCMSSAVWPSFRPPA